MLSGCSSGSGGGSGGSGGGGGTSQPFPPNYVTLSGNWQFQATPSAGITPFTALAGYLNESKTAYGNDVTTAALQVTPSSSSNCYADATVVPMQGTTKATTVGLLSFNDVAQQVSISATKNSTSTQLTGTYSISGGCANGASGTITGTEYADLTGTYSGQIAGNSTSSQTAALKLTQFTTGTGNGVFLVSGSASFTGNSCFSSGTLLAQNGGVIGSTVMLTFSTNDNAGATVTIAGSIDPAAQTLTASSIDVAGGSCPGSLGTAVLKLQ